MKYTTFLLILGMLSWVNATYAQPNSFPPTGNTGIGTANPTERLSIYQYQGQGAYPANDSRGDALQTLQSYNNIMELGVSRKFNDRKAWILTRNSDISGLYGKYYGTLHLQPDIGNKTSYKGVAIGYPSSTHVNNGTHLAINGNVGIGTLSPNNKLDVNGNIRAKEIKVETGWADHVFFKDYKLPSLQEEETHIKTEGHLLGFQSEEEMNGTVLLGDITKRQQVKIEELMLHVIEQQKKIEVQEETIQKQQEVLQALTERLTRIESTLKSR